MLRRLAGEQMKGEASAPGVCLHERIVVDVRDALIHPIAHLLGIHFVESAPRENDDDTFGQIGHDRLQSVQFVHALRR
jgi:hypothetical protein